MKPNSPAADKVEFWSLVCETCDQLEHERNLRGVTTAKCERCNGSGNLEPSRINYDAHGSIWVPPVECRACGGRRRVEVACSPEIEATAIQREINKLRARLRAVKKRVEK